MEPNGREPALAVVIVNYRSWTDLDPLVAILARSTGVLDGLAEVVVVDNGSGESVPKSFDDHRRGVRLILSPENNGFSAGVNVGWRASDARWLLVLNPDVRVEPDFLDRVLERLPGFGPKVGVVGLGLRNADGSRQPSVGVFPGLIRTAWEQLLPRDRRKYRADRDLRPGPVDWVTGACLLVNAGLMADLGGMDEDFFLYHEDVALCRSAWDQGWRVEYDPGVSLVHLRPLQNRAISPKMRIITRHGKLLYFRKHLPGWRFFAMTATVIAEAKVRVAWSRLRGRAGEARGWRGVEQVARRLRSGPGPLGRAVLELAEDAVEEEDRPRAHQPPRPTRWRSHGTRPSRLRKDGPS